MKTFSFELEFEELLVKKTLNQAFSKMSSPENVRETIDSHQINKNIHKFLCDQGILGMLEISNKHKVRNVMLCSILASASGKRLVSFPVIEHLLGLSFLNHSEHIIKDEYESGEKLVTIGWKTNVKLTADNGRVHANGSIKAIPFAPQVNTIIVPLFDEHEKGEKQALIINVDEYRTNLRAQKGQDLTYPLYELSLQDVIVDEVNVQIVKFDSELFNRAADLLFSAELLGIAEEVLQMTLDYSKEREQFGVEIGKFQVIKHMLADMHLLYESIKVSVEFGAWSIENEGEDADIVSSIAKAYASDSAIRIVEDSIQIHGGVGYTWEHDLHLYLKRAYRLANMYKTPNQERERIANYLGNQLNNKLPVKNA
jgi:hypothetical protein